MLLPSAASIMCGRYVALLVEVCGREEGGREGGEGGDGLEPHKTGQVDIMYTFQFDALVQVQGR